MSANFGYVTGKEVEDNAVATLFTDSGAIGVVEAGFVNSHSPFTIEVHGTEGTLLYGTPDGRLLIRTNAGTEAVKEWTGLPLLEKEKAHSVSGFPIFRMIPWLLRICRLPPS